jgi:hypothetical protein
VTADFEVKPLIKEEKLERKFYPMSELRSHTVKSLCEDCRTMETVAELTDGTTKNIPKWILLRLHNIFPNRNPYILGYHPDNFWYALYNNKMVWCESGFVTTERPQLNRYNALTLRKGED